MNKTKTFVNIYQFGLLYIGLLTGQIMIYEYIETIEKLAKNKSLRDGKTEDYLKEVLIETAHVMKCARVNVWTLNDDKLSLDCIFSYHKPNNSFDKEKSLKHEDYPNYFGFLTKNDIIVSNDARSEEINTELVDSYLIPLDIYSMIDVPLRSEGEMVGVICFEHTARFHNWTREEQKFTLSIGQLVSLALEAQKKKEYRIELENLLIQKDFLLSEINHRVKNTIFVIKGLIKTQQKKAHDAYHESLFDDLEKKVRSLASVQDHLQASGEVDNIKLSRYFSEILENLKNTCDTSHKVRVEMNVDDLKLDITKVIPLGLIANEIITNSFKYANLAGHDHPTLKIDCHRENNHINLSFHDNGIGLDKDTGDGMGLELIKSLSEQIDGKITVFNKDGVEIDVEIPV